MPQVPRTANDIILRAFYLIGEVSPNEVPTAAQAAEGLYSFNDLLDSFSAVGVMIPFIKKLNFTMTVGKDEYTISNIAGQNADIDFERIVELDYVNIIRENISYPCRVIKRSELLNNTRLVNLKTRPGFVILIRSDLDSTLKFYPVPAFPYEVNVRAKFMLDHVELFDRLDEVPPYYYRFMRYALARELLNIYPSANWSPQAEKDYEIMLKNVTAAADIDMAIFPDNILMSPFGDIAFDSFGIFS